MKKSGISLIAVLMFMLAATTASIVLFQWIGSENLASGARLKQSEAYQAAESGIEAAQAWLSNKGADVGVITRLYLNQPITTNSSGALSARKPIKLTGTNNILGSVRTAADAERQDFDVYLMGIDTSRSNAPNLKFKILSVGRARDDSEVKLTAIFDVAGLYQMKVPSNTHEILPGDFDPAYFGGSLTFSGNKHFSSAIINGDWGGNPMNIDNDFIVTGNVTASGDLNKVGGKMCVGGNFDPNNGADIGEAYFGSSTNFMGIYRGNVYSEGNMHLSRAADIYGTLSLNGRLTFSGGHNLAVGGNLVIGDENDTAHVNGNGLGDGNNFTVCGSVWTQNIAGVQNVNAQKGERFRFNYNGNYGDELGTNCAASNSGAILSFNGAARQAGNLYKTAPDTPEGHFSSERDNVPGSKPSDAKDIKNYCFSKWKPTPEGHCSEEKYIVEDPIATTLGSIKQFLKEKAMTATAADTIRVTVGETDYNIACLTDSVHTINNGSTNSTNRQYNSSVAYPAINACYQALKGDSAKLYNGYMVIKLNQTSDFSYNLPLNGKFIFIYEANQGSNLWLPPTTPDSRVMLFLEKGASSEVKSPGCVNACAGGNCKYNYFIYSLADINSLNGFDSNCPLEGSFYFPSGSCAGIKNINNNFYGKSNPNLIQELMEAEILCKRNGGTGDCTEEETKQTANPGDTDVDIPISTDHDQDSLWLPISSHLKVLLSSKNISREEEVTDANTLGINSNGHVLVMPRIVRLTKDAFTSFETSVTDPLQYFYSFMHLNNAAFTNTLTRACEIVGTAGLGETDPFASSKGGDILPNNRVYRCKFTGGTAEYSDFYVTVEGENGGAVIRLSDSPPEIDGNANDANDPNNCAQVSIVATENMDNFEAKINALEITGTGWNSAKWTDYTASGALSFNGNTSCGVITSSTDETGIPWTATIKCTEKVQGNVATFTVCSFNQADTTVRFVLDQNVGMNVITNISVVKRGVPELEITRNGITAPEGEVLCPPMRRGDSWISVTCDGGAARGQDSAWVCDYREGLIVKYVLTPPAACKARPDVTGDISLTAIDKAEQPYKISFNEDLIWNSYNITVEGGNLTFSTTDPYVPESERNSGIISDGKSFKVYHGANYTVSYSGALKEIVCTGNLNCNPTSPMYLKSEVLGYITPESNGTLKIQDISAPSATCSQVPNQTSVKRNTNFKFNEYYTIENLIGYGCDNAAIPPSITYTYSKGGIPVDDAQENDQVLIADAGTYTVEAEVLCTSDDGTQRTNRATCADLEVTEFNMQCEWGNGNSDYFVGDTPSVIVRIDSECLAPKVSVSSFTGGETESDWNAAYLNVSSYTYTISMKNTILSTDVSNVQSVTVGTTCNSMPITATCNNKNVENARPCAIPGDPINNPYCPFIASADVRTNENPSCGDTPRCFFVKDIQNAGGAGITINGISDVNGCAKWGWGSVNCSDAFGMPIDGGYYVYVPNDKCSNLPAVTLGDLQCIPQESTPTITCGAWGPKEIFQGENLTLPATGSSAPFKNNTVTCGNGGEPVITAINPMEVATWLDPSGELSPGNYGSVEVTVSKCGSFVFPTPVTVDCGSLVVKNAPSGLTCGSIGGTSANPTPPPLTIADAGNECSNNGSNEVDLTKMDEFKWIYDFGTETNIEKPSWSAIFGAPGNYSNFRVSGKCGSYNKTLTANCNPITVTPDCGGGFTGDMCGGSSSSSGTSIGGEGNPEVTLNANSTYDIICGENGGSQISCKTQDGSSSTFTWDGTTQTSNPDYWGCQSDCQNGTSHTLTVGPKNIVCHKGC